MMYITKAQARKLAFSRYNKNPLNDEWAKVYRTAEIPLWPLVDIIKTIVCQRLDLNVPDLFKDCKDRDYSLARKIALHILYFEYDHNGPMLAKVSKRAQTTITKNRNSLTQEMRWNNSLEDLYNSISEEVKEKLCSTKTSQSASQSSTS